MADNTTLISSAKDFDATPEGWAKRWKSEYEAAKKALQKWQDNGDEIVRVFRAESTKANNPATTIPTRIPLYTGNVQTQRAMLYGEEPRAEVSNRFYDCPDDTARIAGEILERLLNDDLEHPLDTFQPVLGYALDDYQLPGIGVMRWRYDAEVEEENDTDGDEGEKGDETEADDAPEQANAQPDKPDEEPQGGVKTKESCVADYVHWRDFLWSPSRTWLQVRWVGFKAYLTRDDAKRNFGEDIAKELPFSKGVAKKDGASREQDMLKDDPWQRVEVWEFWSKEHRKVFWWVDGYPKVLRVIPDPYELDGFFPMPEPLMANLTTSGFLPRPDYALAQDLYEEFDEVSYRARNVARAIKVRGVFDAKNKALGRILQEAFDQDLIPHENWGAFEKNGGLTGALQFLPIDMLASVLEQLLAYRMQLKQLLDEVTGNGDVMRGAAASVGEEQTATETRSQVRFGSVRLKAKQMRFEKFASDALRLKAEIICKHYSPETIVEQSNLQYTYDAQLAQQAQAQFQQQQAQQGQPPQPGQPPPPPQPPPTPPVDKVAAALKLLKDKFWFYRISVKPNTVSLRDMDAVKTERVQLMESLSQFLTAFGPVAQQAPPLAPMFMQLLKATLAGFEAAEELEGIIDEGVDAWTKAQQQAAAQPPPPDPKLLAVQAKAQADQQKVQGDIQAKAQQSAQEHQQRMTEIAAEEQSDIAKQAAQAHWNIQEEMARSALEQQAEHNAAIRDHVLNPPSPPQSAPLKRPSKVQP